MTILAALDEEQAALLRVAAVALATMADARAKHMPGSDFLAESAGLQREKLRNAIAQLDLGAMPAWKAIKSKSRMDIRFIVECFHKSSDEEDEGRLYAALWAAILAARGELAPLPILPNVQSENL